MPNHRRLFRFRVLLTLSLAYGCGSYPGQSQSPIVSASVNPNLPSASPSPAALRILNQAEIEVVKSSGLVAANNRFGMQLYQQIVQAEPDKNHFISPISAALALQMTLQGADNQTLREMKQVLGLTQISNEELLTAVPLLIRKLQLPTEDIKIEVANSFWASEQFTIVPDFLTAVRGPFQAESETVDFLKADTFVRINNWANQASHGKIPKIVPEPKTLEEFKKYQDTVGFVINAMYFKANWTFPFELEETKDLPFKLESGQVKKVPMMRIFLDLPYHSPTDAFPYQGIALPYGREGKLRMYVFLPTTGKTLSDLNQDLVSSDFEAIRNQFLIEGGSLQMPRFKLNWHRKLNEDLSKMGMPSAFNPGEADFLKLARPRTPNETLYLSAVEQFSFVDVNEEGSEAAVISFALPAAEPSSEPHRTHSMIVDHPFMFLIHDEDTGQILFMGSINDPSLENG